MDSASSSLWAKSRDRYPAMLLPDRTSHYCLRAEPHAVLFTSGVAPSGCSAIAVIEWFDPIPPTLATTLILIKNNTTQTAN